LFWDSLMIWKGILTFSIILWICLLQIFLTMFVRFFIIYILYF
jgi:hypothetical protein